MTKKQQKNKHRKQRNKRKRQETAEERRKKMDADIERVMDKGWGG